MILISLKKESCDSSKGNKSAFHFEKSAAFAGLVDRNGLGTLTRRGRGKKGCSNRFSRSASRHLQAGVRDIHSHKAGSGVWGAGGEFVADAGGGFGVFCKEEDVAAASGSGEFCGGSPVGDTV